MAGGGGRRLIECLIMIISSLCIIINILARSKRLKNPISLFFLYHVCGMYSNSSQFISYISNFVHFSLSVCSFFLLYFPLFTFSIYLFFTNLNIIFTNIILENKEKIIANSPETLNTSL